METSEASSIDSAVGRVTFTDFVVVVAVVNPDSLVWDKEPSNHVAMAILPEQDGSFAAECVAHSDGTVIDTSRLKVTSFLNVLSCTLCAVAQAA